MLSVCVAVGLLTAAANGTAATLDFLRRAWLVEHMTRVGCRAGRSPRSPS